MRGSQRGGIRTVLSLCTASLLATLTFPCTAPAEPGEERTRATLERALPANAILHGPLAVGTTVLATVTLDLSELDDATTLPVHWSGGAAPVGVAEDLRARLSATPATLFYSGLPPLDLDLTASPDRPLVLHCRVSPPENEGLPYPLQCGLASPYLATADEARRYLMDATLAAEETICDCDLGEGSPWTLTLPADASDRRRLLGPSGGTWTLANQSSQTHVSITGGETSHSLRYVLIFEGERPLRLDAVLEGELARSLSAADHIGAHTTLAGRLRQATGSGTVRCEIHDPPPAPSGDMFDSPGDMPPLGQGTLTCAADGAGH